MFLKIVTNDAYTNHGEWTPNGVTIIMLFTFDMPNPLKRTHTHTNGMILFFSSVYEVRKESFNNNDNKFPFQFYLLRLDSVEIN